MTNVERIDRLERNRDLPDEDFLALLTSLSPDEETYLYARARAVCDSVYGRDVYLRGLIEVSNICRNDCRYCGIRKSNKKAQRYRLSDEQILACADKGYALGFRTIVMQGGEDFYFTCDHICTLVRAIKEQHPDVAVTLSIGEKSEAEYRAYYEAGADRFLLREETSDADHYALLHPPELSMTHRQNCLRILKRIGYQVGSGVMVGSPGQTPQCLLKDLRFMQELGPHMIGVGPFIPHKDTPFCDQPAGSLADTLHYIAILRLLFPHALIPATTAVGTIDPHGWEKGMLAGCNVIMPNLSPYQSRGKYMLYNNKISTGYEDEKNRIELEKRLASVGCHTVVCRGDYKN